MNEADYKTEARALTAARAAAGEIARRHAVPADDLPEIEAEALLGALRFLHEFPLVASAAAGPPEEGRDPVYAAALEAGDTWRRRWRHKQKSEEILVRRIREEAHGDARRNGTPLRPDGVGPSRPWVGSQDLRDVTDRSILEGEERP